LTQTRFDQDRALLFGDPHVVADPHSVASESCWSARQKFDAVVSASAFHWLDPRTRFSKSANSLDHKARSGFLEDIEQLIESKYRGTVARNFVYEVTAARRTGTTT
jgi:hypothetical protein